MTLLLGWNSKDAINNERMKEDSLNNDNSPTPQVEDSIMDDCSLNVTNRQIYIELAHTEQQIIFLIRPKYRADMRLKKVSFCNTASSFTSLNATLEGGL